jgi:hypothetical protein
MDEHTERKSNGRKKNGKPLRRTIELTAEDILSVSRLTPPPFRSHHRTRRIDKAE